MFSAYHEYGKIPMALSCRHSGFYGPSKDQNVFCIVNCKEDYDNLKLACKPIFQKINKLYEKGSSAVEGKQFDLDILMARVW
jgi:hypothetical protein